MYSGRPVHIGTICILEDTSPPLKKEEESGSVGGKEGGTGGKGGTGSGKTEKKTKKKQGKTLYDKVC